MHMPSNSWGKFNVKLVNKTLSDYISNDEEDISEEELNQCMINFNKKNKVYTMKKILEEWAMPVYNAKTGEQDFVDLSLVDKIVIDSQYVQDMLTNKVLKVSFTVSGDKEKKAVSIKSELENKNLKTEFNITQQDFEEMLFKAINEVKSQKLEEVDEFDIRTRSLLNDLIEESWKKELYLTTMNAVHNRDVGIGIIRDMKTDQEVGTFESFSFEYVHAQQTARFHNIILSGRTLEDLKEKERFEFIFYSLLDKVSYSLIASDKTTFLEEEKGIGLKMFSLDINEFNDSNVKHELIANAEQSKDLIRFIDQGSPIYGVNYEKFRQERLNILEESKAKQKQQKLINQFADIDLF